MSTSNPISQFDFLADKVYVHKWPMNSPTWSMSSQEKIDLDLHKNPEKKKIRIKEKMIWINDYEFSKLNKVGITVPLFKRETTMVFEGHFQGLDAHIHITIISKNFLKIFNRLMDWKSAYFDEFEQ